MQRRTGSESPYIARPGFLTVIRALMLREYGSRFARRRWGYVWAMIEPGAYVVSALTLFFLLDRRVLVRMSMPLFILTGMGPWLVFMRVDNFIRVSVTANIALLYHPVLKPLHMYIARFLTEAATVTVFFSLTFIGYGLLSGNPQVIPQHPEALVEGLCLCLAMAFGVGSCLSAVMIRSEGLAYASSFCIRAMSFTSGIYFLPDYAPPVIRPLVAWNPMTHAIALFRSGFMGIYPSHVMNPGYTVIVAATLIVTGLVAERYLVRRWVGH